MKRAHFGVFVVVLSLVWSCGSDKETSGPSSSGSFGGGPQDSGTTSASSNSVDCTHPGAGKALGADQCECTTTHVVAGEWSGFRTCREGDVCPTKDKAETLVITQNGTSISAQKDSDYLLTGTICGDYIVWSGGPKDGLNPECGQLRLLDETHYVSDSCYATSGECRRSFGQGCPSLKGQCTGTGAKKPETAASIKKVLCN
jgi:hypothetical protein